MQQLNNFFVLFFNFFAGISKLFYDSYPRAWSIGWGAASRWPQMMSQGKWVFLTLIEFQIISDSWNKFNWGKLRILFVSRQKLPTLFCLFYKQLKPITLMLARLLIKASHFSKELLSLTFHSVLRHLKHVQDVRNIWGSIHVLWHHCIPNS